MGKRLRKAQKPAEKAVAEGWRSYPLREAQVKSGGNRLNSGVTG